MSEFLPSDALLDTLYQAPTDFKQWEAFLKELAHGFHGMASVVQYGDHEEKDYSFFAVYGINPARFSDYARHIDHDPMTEHYKRRPNQAITDNMILEPGVFQKSLMYQNVFQPLGIEHRLSYVWMGDSLNQSHALGVFREPGSPPFDQADCDRLGEFTPHIRRAIHLQKQFAKIQEERWSALKVLDQMPMGIIVCDHQTRVLFANRMAREIAREADGLTIHHGELWANRQEDSAALRELVKATVEGAEADEPHLGGALSLPRTEALNPLHVRVNPIWKNDAPFSIQALSRPVAAVYITDPDRPQETPAELLQRMFGLTPKEALFLHYLTRGLEVAEAADQMGVTQNTARTHLKSLFAKTDTSRQADLVKLVVTSPAWILHMQ